MIDKTLLLIILGAGISSAYYFFKDYINKKEIKKQERLNRIKWIMIRATLELLPMKDK